MNWMVSTDLSTPTTSSRYIRLEPSQCLAVAMGSLRSPALPRWAAARPRPSSRTCAASSLQASSGEGVLGAQSCWESQWVQQWGTLAGQVPLEAWSGETTGARGSSRSHVPAVFPKLYFWRRIQNHHNSNEIPKFNLSFLNPYLHK